MNHWLTDDAQNADVILADCRWRRDKHDPKAYRLMYESPAYKISLTKVWRHTNRDWSGLSGHTRNTLKEIKAIDEAAVVERTATRMEELLCRLSGLADGATKNAAFELNIFESHAFERLLYAKVTSITRARIASEHDWIVLPKDGGLANALVSIENRAFHFSMLEPQRTYSYQGPEKRCLRLDQLTLWGSMLRERFPTLYETDLDFEAAGRAEFVLASLDESALTAGVDTLITAVVQHVNEAA